MTKTLKLEDAQVGRVYHLTMKSFSEDFVFVCTDIDTLYITGDDLRNTRKIENDWTVWFVDYAGYDYDITEMTETQNPEYFV